MTAARMLGASGMPVACARPLTTEAPASTAAEPMNPLRDIMMGLLILFFRSLLSGRRGHRAAGAVAGFARGSAADDGGAEIDAGKPERALRLDRRDGHVDALARFGEQREHVDQHGVVAQQR